MSVSRARLLRKPYMVFPALFLILFCSTEGYFRWIYKPSLPEVRSLFHKKLSVARLTFINANQDRLQLDDWRKQTHPNEDRLVPAEPDRPPFDRIHVPYRIKTNARGYRERPLPGAPADGVSRILLLGDSVSFGKGVDRDARFSNLVEAEGGGKIEVYNLGIPSCTSTCMAENLGIFLPLKPDLVILQGSSNDLDQTLWRLGMETRISGALALLVRVASWSRTLLLLDHHLRGDPWDQQLEQAKVEVARHYGSALDEIFSTCRQRGIPVVVLTAPFSDGTRFAEHVAAACGRYSDACLGVVKAGFQGAPASAPGATAARKPDWVLETARFMGFPPAALRQVFVHGRFFHDIVHPNTTGNQVMAQALLTFLRATWGPMKQPPAAAPSAP